MRTLEQSSPATAVEGAAGNGEQISVLSQTQTLPPGMLAHAETNYSFSISRNNLIIYWGEGWGGEVHICFTFITYLHYIPHSSAKPSLSTSCREIESEQLMLFQCVSHSCFSSAISLFFFPLSPPFFLRLEQIQCDWQKIGRLQQSRGSDFSSK